MKINKQYILGAFFAGGLAFGTGQTLLKLEPVESLMMSLLAGVAGYSILETRDLKIQRDREMKYMIMESDYLGKLTEQTLKNARIQETNSLLSDLEKEHDLLKQQRLNLELLIGCFCTLKN